MTQWCYGLKCLLSVGLSIRVAVAIPKVQTVVSCIVVENSAVLPRKFSFRLAASQSPSKIWRAAAAEKNCDASTYQSNNFGVSRKCFKPSTPGSSEYLLVHRRSRIVYYLVEFRQWLNINKFSFINQIKFDHHWCKIMLHQLNVVGASCESTFVLKRKADILSISNGISIYQRHSNILVDIC